MNQLGLRYNNEPLEVDLDGRVDEIDIDGYVDEKHNISYIGKAVWVDGVYRCLANVGGCLCIVEVTLRFS